MRRPSGTIFSWWRNGRRSIPKTFAVALDLRCLYSGLVQYGLSVPEGPGLPLLRKAGEEQGWKTLNRHYHADDHAVGHAWMEMAMEDGNPAAAEKIRAVLDKVMNRPSSASSNS